MKGQQKKPLTLIGCKMILKPADITAEEEEMEKH